MPHSLLTTRITMRAPKYKLYHFLIDAAAALAEKPLNEEDDTYSLEVSFDGCAAMIFIKECRTRDLVFGKVFNQESA